MSRKPWEIPIQYFEDRFEPAPKGDAQPKPEPDDDARDGRDVEEILRREDRPAREYECKDTTPINYNKGPHDDEFGVADKDELGPPDEEFNLDDEDENALEPAEDLYPDEQDD